MDRLPTLSYTAIKDFKQCQHKFHQVRVARVIPKQPPTPEQEWGTQVHLALELAIRDGVPMTGAMEPYEVWAELVRQTMPGAEAELAMALAPDGTGAQYSDGGVAVRGVSDVVHVFADNSAMVLDWKTGTLNPKYAPIDQIELMALMVMARYPEVQKVRGRLAYIKEANPWVSRDVTRDEFQSLWAKWSADIAAIQRAHSSGVWHKKPSPLCGWCPVKDCEYWHDGPAKKALRGGR